MPEHTIWELTLYDKATNRRIVQNRFTDGFICEVVCMYTHADPDLVRNVQSYWDLYKFSTESIDVLINVVSPYTLCFISTDGNLHTEQYTTFESALAEFETLCDLEESRLEKSSDTTLAIISHEEYRHTCLDYALEISA